MNLNFIYFVDSIVSTIQNSRNVDDSIYQIMRLFLFKVKSLFQPRINFLVPYLPFKFDHNPVYVDQTEHAEYIIITNRDVHLMLLIIHYVHQLSHFREKFMSIQCDNRQKMNIVMRSSNQIFNFTSIKCVWTLEKIITFFK